MLPIYHDHVPRRCTWRQLHWRCCRLQELRRHRLLLRQLHLGHHRLWRRLLLLLWLLEDPTL
jgi:hypothetical protein